MSGNFVNGSVRIADEILDQIAVGAASDVYGVYYAEDQDKNFSFHKKNPRSKVEKIGQNLHFNLSVNFDRDINVRKAVKDIQESVKNVVENMTGISVTRVDVSVLNLEI
ncbi:Asp23/Gls24 family envelope stress response protein [uncultured Anaerococcus sp.]|uniref:Asp23/Gls24 family envelope stress response protein n=1 Tax=uncultured Anaerococcus sp. TaxID=293428 RepID=UPI002889F9BF|nr:Asp23/Gls24 family envelope stress response protein [uncultured Anaerococcus sp.]